MWDGTESLLVFNAVSNNTDTAIDCYSPVTLWLNWNTVGAMIVAKHNHRSQKGNFSMCQVKERSREKNLWNFLTDLRKSYARWMFFPIKSTIKIKYNEKAQIILKSLILLHARPPLITNAVFEKLSEFDHNFWINIHCMHQENLQLHSVQI